VTQIKTAFWATDVVRGMALTDNRPFSWTPLRDVLGLLRYTANCADFAAALLQVLGEVNLQLTARQVDVALNPNGYDGHSLVELFDPDGNRWMLLDPTLDLTVRRTADGTWATADDISAATHALQWGDVTYVFLGEAVDAYARSYYLDYPLLFNDVYHAGSHPVNGQGAPVLPYLTERTLPVATPGIYTVQCSGVTSVELAIDGIVQVLDCSGVDGLSFVTGAHSIVPTANTAGTIRVYSVGRFVF
jgi:hypothetical protein